MALQRFHRYVSWCAYCYMTNVVKTDHAVANLLSYNLTYNIDEKYIEKNYLLFSLVIKYSPSVSCNINVMGINDIVKTCSLKITTITSSFIPIETHWGPLGPVAYESYHCVSLKNGFPLKLYVFHKNIVLHNIMCETNWIVIRTKFYW